MVLRLVKMPSLETIELKRTSPVAFGVGSADVESGKYRVPITDVFYLLDPKDANSVNKTNFVDPSRTYPFDGDLSTTGSFVSTTSTTPVDADAGVDMGTAEPYLVCVRLGLRSSTSGYTSNAGLAVSADLTNWTVVWSVSTNSTTEGLFSAALMVRNYRAFKVVMWKGTGTANVRTYELSVYRLEMV